jgi:hypothetical protein
MKAMRGLEKGISDLRMRMSGHRWLMMMAPSRAARCGVDRGRGESVLERMLGGAGDEVCIDWDV